MIFALKLTLTPLLIALTTLVQRRWGGHAAGLLAGLPLTSAPVSVFLALEFGSEFASHAAIGTLLGAMGMSGFCVAYALAARRLTWPWAAAIATTSCAIITVAASLLPPHLGLAAAVTFLALSGLVRLIGPAEPYAPAIRPPGWDLPARMALAAGSVLAITGTAHLLGPKWTGLVSPLPIFAFVLAVFTHRLGGYAPTQRLLRGMAVGTFGAAAFFVTVGAGVMSVGLPACYLLASLVAAAVATLSQRLLSPARPRPCACTPSAPTDESTRIPR